MDCGWDKMKFNAIFRNIIKKQIQSLYAKIHLKISLHFYVNMSNVYDTSNMLPFCISFIYGRYIP